MKGLSRILGRVLDPKNEVGKVVKDSKGKGGNGVRQVWIGDRETGRWEGVHWHDANKPIYKVRCPHCHEVVWVIKYGNIDAAGSDTYCPECRGCFNIRG